MSKGGTKKEKRSLLEFEVNVGGAGLAQMAVFAKQLSVMLQSGLVITEALAIAADSSKGKLQKVLQKVLKSVESGRSLSEAFGDHPKVFSGLFQNAAKAGEGSGTLEENLEHIATQLEKEKELAAKIKGAMVYPAVVLSAAFVLGLALAFLVLPQITPLFEGLRVELPATTRAIIWFSNLIQAHGGKLLLGIIVGVVGLVWLVRQKFTKPFTHMLLLRIPILNNISKHANTARFCRTLGTLLKSGVPIDEAVRITSGVLGNFYYERAIKNVAAHVGKGTKISDELEQFPELFPQLVTRMVQVGEESGKLEDVLLYLAGYYEVEVDTSAKSLSTAIEPLLLIFIGLVVGFLALSIITPIYDITGSVR